MAETRISVTVRMPGRFDGYFSGSGIGQGQYDKNDPVEALVYYAWDNSALVNVHAGYYKVVLLEGPLRTVKAALDLFMDSAETCVVVNTDNPNDPAEKRAARSFIKCLEITIKEIG